MPRFDSGCVLSQDPAISYICSEKTLNDDQRKAILKVSYQYVSLISILPSMCFSVVPIISKVCHIGWRKTLFVEILLTLDPIIISDTHCKGLCTHIRNAWDRQNIHHGPCCKSIVT